MYGSSFCVIIYTSYTRHCMAYYRRVYKMHGSTTTDSAYLDAFGADDEQFAGNRVVIRRQYGSANELIESRRTHQLSDPLPLFDVGLRCGPQRRRRVLLH